MLACTQSCCMEEAASKATPGCNYASTDCVDRGRGAPAHMEFSLSAPGNATLRDHDVVAPKHNSDRQTLHEYAWVAYHQRQSCSNMASASATSTFANTRALVAGRDIDIHRPVTAACAATYASTGTAMGRQGAYASMSQKTTDRTRAVTGHVHSISAPLIQVTT